MIERDAFRDWLISLEPSMPVGDMTCSTGHPFATYARITLGQRYAFIGRQVAMFGTDTWALPEWALMFDRAFEGQRNLTASEALAFFDSKEA